MEHTRVIEELKQIIIAYGLPQADVALYGVTCPYCGKSDRIRELDAPESLTVVNDATQKAAYENLYRELTSTERSMGVCKFCLNLVHFNANGEAAPLTH